ncbi:sodium/glucose cotransporter 4 [Patella vulgata]|uniref:sodium/glucose cotransporter 4 n=1 Tax=Patella vulgata TaxID=6465 RepID=UPI0024A8DF0C|nr:sodium/glucose cotransporter 4 [Patella vulgata]
MVEDYLVASDYVLIGIYFVLVLAVGLWSTFRPNRNSAAGYFLAGKDMHWIPVGASIFASNVGAPMFIGLAGTAAASGFAVAIYEWHSIYLLIALGWVFVPVYVASGAFTMPEYLKKRFGGKRLRIYLSSLALVLYVLTKISSEIYSGAIFMRQLLGWNLYLCVVTILAVTAFYTIAGGLAAVIYTDTLQTVILLFGAFILTVMSFIEVGGWEQMMRKYSMAAANYTLANPENYSCGLPRSDFNHIWRDAETGDIPWPGAAIGLTTLGLWVWCTDQIMVQTCLSAKDMSHAIVVSLLPNSKTIEIA